jgi:hypothetical protein
MLWDARSENACSACAIRLLPVPFSPVMRTFASDGATREIISITGRIEGASAIKFGTFPPRSLLAASSFRPLRNALANSICVRTIVSSRWLSHGFGTKSRAPRFIASTARSIVAHAVITTIGRVLSSAWIFGMTSSPSCPEVVSRV